MEILHHTSAPGNDPPTAAGGEVGQGRAKGLGAGKMEGDASLVTSGWAQMKVHGQLFVGRWI